MLEGFYYCPHITYGERRIRWRLVTVTQLLRSRGRRLWLPSSGFPTTAASQPQRSNSPTRHHNPTMFLHQKWSLPLTSTETFSCLYPRAPRAPLRFHSTPAHPQVLWPQQNSPPHSWTSCIDFYRVWLSLSLPSSTNIDRIRHCSGQWERGSDETRVPCFTEPTF